PEPAPRVEDLDARAAIAVAVHRDEVVLAVAGHVPRSDRRAPEVVLPLRALVHVARDHKPLRARIEDVQTHARVRVLVERGDLVRTPGAREMPDGETRARRVELTSSGVVDPLRPAERQGRTVRLERVDPQVEVLALVGDKERVPIGPRELAAQQGTSSAPRIVIASPPRISELEARTGRSE